MKGKLIVFEGLDCSGKTTAIKELIKSNILNKNFIYSKGIGSNNFIGKLSKKFPSTFGLHITLLYNILTKIKPNLKKGKIILQDRYDISINSFIPNINRFYNKVIIKFFKKFLIKPDAIIYFYLPINDRIIRLKEKGTKYELILANNPELIKLRENEYIKWYNNFNGPEIKIDTQKNNLEKTSEIIKNFILKL